MILRIKENMRNWELFGLVRWIKCKVRYWHLRHQVKTNQRNVERSFIAKDQRIAYDIVRMQARKPIMDILIDPNSGEIYITDIERRDRDKHGANDQSIILSNSGVSIINGIYQYHVVLGGYAVHALDRYLKRIITRKRQRLKAKMEEKVEKSLATILEKTMSKTQQ